MQHQRIIWVFTELSLSSYWDHRIVLKDESKPINVPPCPYIHFQKKEIERQVEEMLGSMLRLRQTIFFTYSLGKEEGWDTEILHRLQGSG